MKKVLVISLLMAATVLFIHGNALAYSLSVNYVDGITYETTALTGFSTDGSMMDGMSVTASFKDGESEQLSWSDYGSMGGGVTSSGWYLHQLGDTFGSDWTLQSHTNISSIVIDAGTGDAVFDVVYYNNDEDKGTPGSQYGRPFEVQGTNFDGDITATYSDLVTLSGNEPWGDLYRTLTIDFADGFGPNNYLSFIADTDNLSISGDIQPHDPVPEPATMLLLGSGLLGSGALARRRRKQG